MILKVGYVLQYRSDNFTVTLYIGESDPTNNWEVQAKWSSIPNDGAYRIWAEATDDEGARTATEPITVTLHPSSK